MPSGTLCSVTASVSVWVWLLSGAFLSIRYSSSTPSHSPTAAGRNAHVPSGAARSMAGISRLPHRRRGHDPGGEAQQHPLQAVARQLVQEKDARRAQRRAEKREQYPHSTSVTITLSSVSIGAHPEPGGSVRSILRSTPVRGANARFCCISTKHWQKSGYFRRFSDCGGTDKRGMIYRPLCGKRREKENMKKKVFTPALFDCLKHYSGRQFTKDLVSGVIVAIIALPLSIALALASGVSPEQGIYTAIIAGFLISLFGGSCVQIAGPTAAFATIVAGIVAQHGMGGLALATVMA